MKLIESSFDTNVKKYALQSDIDDNYLAGSINNYCDRLENSQNDFAKKIMRAEASVNKIKSFMKKTIAAQSYGKMFTHGEFFKLRGLHLEPKETERYSLHSLAHLDKLSQENLSKIKNKVTHLTVKEKVLLTKIVDTKWHYRHQSNAPLVTDKLNILSLHKLQLKKISCSQKTTSRDIKYLHNHDFVFCGVEFSGEIDQLPLNTRHSTVDYGANAYLLDKSYSYGYLTLTDHFFNLVPPMPIQEHWDFFSRFDVLPNEIHRFVHGDRVARDIPSHIREKRMQHSGFSLANKIEWEKQPLVREDVPLYSEKDMKLAVGLHLIEFIRNSKDADFKSFVLDENITSKDLDRVLNAIFQPEFHIPRMVSESDYKTVKLREMSLKEAISASNTSVLIEMLNSKDLACKALVDLVAGNKADMINYLLEKFTITKNDLADNTALEYAASYYADLELIKYLLKYNLLDINVRFKGSNAGDSMLDNLMRRENKAGVDLFLSLGATSGADDRKRECEKIDAMLAAIACSDIEGLQPFLNEEKYIKDLFRFTIEKNKIPTMDFLFKHYFKNGRYSSKDLLKFNIYSSLVYSGSSDMLKYFFENEFININKAFIIGGESGTLLDHISRLFPERKNVINTLLNYGAMSIDES